MTDSINSQPLATVAHVPVSEDTYSRLRELLDWISACGNEIELHNVVIPAIRDAGMPTIFHDRLAQALQAQLKFHGGSVPIGKLRTLLFPPALPRTDGGLPEWAKPFCWVTSQDAFFNTSNGEFLSLRSFDVAYGRKMPIGESGRRASAAEKCTQFWNMPIVEQVGYRPDCGPYYEWDGVRYANLYSSTSLPPVASLYTPQGWAGITAFQNMLYDMCGRRNEVYWNLLCWMAHNVQKPGVKIRWAPVIKGVHGDGKTLAASVLRAAMGHRNVSTTSNSNISNSGGFTDWAVRGAVNVIEEIMLTGKARHQLYNAMKEFISNNIVDVNMKGRKPRQLWNSTNHWANTNHNDGLPLEQTDRRWFVIFTPWASLDEMFNYCGIDAAGWKKRIEAIDHAKNHCAGEVRAWFLSLSIPPTFDINGSAMMTPEKRRMMASGKDDVESVIEGIITEGAAGVTEQIVSTAHLSAELRRRALLECFVIPQTSTLSHMLTRLGYSKHHDQIKWRGERLRVWVRNGVELSNDKIRLWMDDSVSRLATFTLGE